MLTILVVVKNGASEGWTFIYRNYSHYVCSIFRSKNSHNFIKNEYESKNNYIGKQLFKKKWTHGQICTALSTFSYYSDEK